MPPKNEQAETTLFDATATDWSSPRLILASAGALVCGLGFARNVLFGENRPELAETTPLWGLATAGFVAVMAWWWPDRRRLTLVERDGKQVLELTGARPILLTAPFRVELGWSRVIQPRQGDAQIRVEVVFRDGERPVLALLEQRKLHARLPPWPEKALVFEGAEATVRLPGVEALVSRLRR